VTPRAGTAIAAIRKATKLLLKIYRKRYPAATLARAARSFAGALEAPAAVSPSSAQRFFRAL
jgi:hypothetical protein